MKKLLLPILLFCTTFAHAACDSQTVLMPHFNGADASTTFTDSENTPKTLTAVGNAQLDTAQFKFGTASLLLDGTGDYATLLDSADWDFGTGDWTIDFQMRRVDTLTDQMAFELGSGPTDGIRFNVKGNAGNQVETTINGTARLLVASAFSTATWYHIEIERSGTTMYYFVDGTMIDTWTETANISGGTAGVAIGATTTGIGTFNGWIDEFRISKGIARHTGNFTAPTSEYCASSPARFMQII